MDTNAWLHLSFIVYGNTFWNYGLSRLRSRILSYEAWVSEKKLSHGSRLRFRKKNFRMDRCLGLGIYFTANRGVTKWITNPWKWDPGRFGRPLGRQVVPKIWKSGSIFTIFEALWDHLANFGRHFGPGCLDMAARRNPNGHEHLLKSMAKSTQKPMPEHIEKWYPNDRKMM